MSYTETLQSIAGLLAASNVATRSNEVLYDERYVRADQWLGYVSYDTQAARK